MFRAAMVCERACQIATLQCTVAPMSFRLVLEDLNLAEAEKNLCIEALNAAGTIVDAAKLLGITRHALKRRIIKHRIEWPKKVRVE